MYKHESKVLEKSNEELGRASSPAEYPFAVYELDGNKLVFASDGFKRLAGGNGGFSEKRISEIVEEKDYIKLAAAILKEPSTEGNDAKSSRTKIIAKCGKELSFMHLAGDRKYVLLCGREGKNGINTEGDEQEKNGSNIGILFEGIAKASGNSLTTALWLSYWMAKNCPQEGIFKEIAIINREMNLAADSIKDLICFMSGGQISKRCLNLNHTITAILKMRKYAQREAGIECRLALSDEGLHANLGRAELQHAILELIISMEYYLAKRKHEKILNISTSLDGDKAKVYVTGKNFICSTENSAKKVEYLALEGIEETLNDVPVVKKYESVLKEFGGSLSKIEVSKEESGFCMKIPITYETGFKKYWQKDTSRRNILILEPDKLLCDAYKKVLHQEGYRIEFIRQDEGKKEYISSNYDAIVVDIGGLETAKKYLYRELYEDSSKKEKILITTLGGISKERSRLISELNRPFMMKPFTPEDFIMMIEML